MVVSEGLFLTIAGLAVGTLAAFWLTRLLESLLFGIVPRNPVTFAASSLLLSAVAVLASYIPAVRATRIDPMAALRHE
jgi:putative ABC transport system permease protein